VQKILPHRIKMAAAAAIQSGKSFGIVESSGPCNSSNCTGFGLRISAFGIKTLRTKPVLIRWRWRVLGGLRKWLPVRTYAKMNAAATPLLLEK
jgi:hypothetical protein